ncbi:MAG: SMI1/KNR4 family protein [Scytolyngbya sp. HA4215-MV1]|jgi:hypothetical protein|nr:SMI1/KNR4 family protein [Scytolyngbya sp. HA4215-MV1]
MADFEWESLLRQFSQKLIAELNDRNREQIPPATIAAGWLGYPGASEAQIVQAETRLGTQFPPSYREFLQVSNGWINADWTTLQLWSTEEVTWFRNSKPDWIWPPYTNARPSVPDEKYFIYGESQDPVHLRAEYLDTALEISSDSGDGDIYLLIPAVIDRRGEWEAWHFGSKLPGAYRYRSFYELMQKALEWGKFVN